MSIIKLLHRLFNIAILLSISLFLLSVVTLFALPVDINNLILQPYPSESYQESLQRIENLRNSRSDGVNPASHLILKEHGYKTDRVIVFFHGFTNSPRQFNTLGTKFFEQGYNVLIPLIPHHGLENQDLFELEKLTAQELSRTATEAIDIAQGLGEHVTIVGLSMGGVMAGWSAQHREDVDLAVLIAPSVGTYRVPNIFLKPSINLMVLSQDRFIWWDKSLKNKIPRPTAAYQGFSSRALGEIRKLGWGVQKIGKQVEPRAGKILMITNENDTVVSKDAIDVIVRQWRTHNTAKIDTFEFQRSLRLGHDLIDPEQPNQNVAMVYPQLISLITSIQPK